MVRPAQPPRSSFSRLLFLLVSLGFIALIAAAASVAWLQRLNQDQNQIVRHTLEVQSTLANFSTLMERTETARRGFLLAPSGDFGKLFDQGATPIPGVLAHLRSLVRDNPVQEQRATLITRMSERQRRLQLATLQAAMSDHRDRLVEHFATDPTVALTRSIRSVVARMNDEETRLLSIRGDRQQRTQTIFYLVLAGLGLLLIAVAATTLVVMNRYTAELARSRDELWRLNTDLEGLVDERTSELTRANDEIQRFAYIVSHDLRSPLVNVLGFTAELEKARVVATQFLDRVEEGAPKLVDSDARLALREDLPEAIGFIRSSTQKMDRLINAILRLSREGRRTLTPERLDMNRLAEGIVDSLQHRVNELGAEIVVGDLPSITSDRVAIEQVLSNLVENAVKYLAPARPGRIAVRGEVQGNRVIIDVTDNGRGIDPKDHQRIFDLFRRSGAQDQPGEGIGLAHVRALAYRLGGVIDVRSELDRGATFRLSLPQILDKEVVSRD